MHFFCSVQAEYFHNTILKIEGDNVSVVDIAHHLEVLKGNIMCREQEEYLDPNTEDEKNVLIESGDYNAIIVDAVNQFYGN